MQLTLQQLFGNSASQDSQQLIINKADLPSLNLANNIDAEKLFAALILLANQTFEGNLVDASGEAVCDELGESIAYQQYNLYEKLNIHYWKRQFIKRNEVNFIVDTFVIDVFVSPNAPYGVQLSSIQLE